MNINDAVNLCCRYCGDIDSDGTFKEYKSVSGKVCPRCYEENDENRIDKELLLNDKYGIIMNFSDQYKDIPDKIISGYPEKKINALIEEFREFKTITVSEFYEQKQEKYEPYRIIKFKHSSPLRFTTEGDMFLD